MTERKTIVKAVALLLATVMTVAMLPAKMQVVEAAPPCSGWSEDSSHPGYCVLIHIILLSRYFITFCRVVTSSSIVSSRPARISSTTQVLIWEASSVLLKLFNAQFTADT